MISDLADIPLEQLTHMLYEAYVKKYKCQVLDDSCKKEYILGLKQFLLLELSKPRPANNSPIVTNISTTTDLDPARIHKLTKTGLRTLRKSGMRWRLEKSTWIFLLCVFIIQFTIGSLEYFKTINDEKVTAAFGYGPSIAKFCAGALYPTLFLLVMSMSRWTATYMRQSRQLSKLFDWDKSRTFHVLLAVMTLILGSIHGLAHLFGTFYTGSEKDRRVAVVDLIGTKYVNVTYSGYMQSVPGWTGLVSIFILFTLATFSTTVIRRRWFEIFQLGHLLIYLFVGLMFFHGTAAFFQTPLLAYILSGPVLCVALERIGRFLNGLYKIKASISVIDKDTLTISCRVPDGRRWTYKAGQYAFLQVATISRLQWHPFTISACDGREVTFHIKAVGDWTLRLHDLAKIDDGGICIGLDGPYGAPAQRFYEFDTSIVIGSGTGITPFAGILNDLRLRYYTVPIDKLKQSIDGTGGIEEGSRCGNGNSRVDFHWIVRDEHHLEWFKGLLSSLASDIPSSNLDLRLSTHITCPTSIVQHKVNKLAPWIIGRYNDYLLPTAEIKSSMYRHATLLKTTCQHPCSDEQSVKVSYGRPNFRAIFKLHYNDMVLRSSPAGGHKIKVGVFFCGSPALQKELRNICRDISMKGKAMGVNYVFITEVF